MVTMMTMMMTIYFQDLTQAEQETCPRPEGTSLTCAGMGLPNNTKLDNQSKVYLDKISTDELAVVVSLYALLLFAIIVGNGLVLVAFSINKRLWTATNRLIMGLAVSDVLVGFVSIPCWLYISISPHKKTPVSYVTYQFYITFDIFVGSASILQLTALSIERCHAIVRPLRHRTLSMKVYYVMILAPWLYAAIIASLQPVQFQRWSEMYTLLMTTTCFFIPFVIIFVAYLSIYRFARCQPISKHRTERKAYKKDLRLSVTLAVITGLFVVAWLPLFVVSMIGTYYPQYLPPTQGTDRVLQLVKFCHYSNSALNPLVYAFRNNEMIRTFRYIGYRLLCRLQEPPLTALSRSSLYRLSSRRTSLSFRRNSSCKSSGRPSSLKKTSVKSSSVRTTSVKSGSGSKRSQISFREGIDVNGNQGNRHNKDNKVPFVYSTV